MGAPQMPHLRDSSSTTDSLGVSSPLHRLNGSELSPVSWIISALSILPPDLSKTKVHLCPIAFAPPLVDGREHLVISKAVLMAGIVESVSDEYARL